MLYLNALFRGIRMSGGDFYLNIFSEHSSVNWIWIVFKGHVGANVFIDAYPSWSITYHMSLLHFFGLQNWMVVRSLRVFEDQKGLSSVLESIWQHVSGQILSLTVGHAFYSLQLAMHSIHVPWILVLVPNDLAEGTAFDKTKCLQWISCLIASCSMCKSWLS